jgi:hypothetical protein
LVELLGEMGDLKVETDALLRDNNFGPDDFSDAVLKNIGFEEWSVSNESEESLALRKDFREEKTFTIDPNGSDQLDDAIHVKEVADGVVEIGIHVADAAYFVKANSLVDREAKKRGTGVYLMNRAVNMLPPRLSSEICSLSPGQERFTVSVVFKVNLETGRVLEDEAWIGKAIIKSAGKVTYDDVDAVIHGDSHVNLEGATVRDIQILKVRPDHPFSLMLLRTSRGSLKSSARHGMVLRPRTYLLFVSFTSWTMRMCRWSATFSTRPRRMKSSKNSITKPTTMWLRKLQRHCLRKPCYAGKHHPIPGD